MSVRPAVCDNGGGFQAYADVPDQALADPAAAADVRLTLRDVLAELPALDRVVLVLRYLEDLSVEEVAVRTGLSAGAASAPRSSRPRPSARSR